MLAAILACSAVSSAVSKVLLAARLASTATVLADTTLTLAFKRVNVTKSLEALAVVAILVSS